MALMLLIMIQRTAGRHAAGCLCPAAGLYDIMFILSRDASLLP